MLRKLVRISGAVFTAVLLFASSGLAQTFDVSGGYAWPPAGVMVSATDFRKIAERVLADTVSRAAGGDLRAPVTQEVLEGDAAAVLIRESAGADLLVVGSRGHGGLAEAMLGSVGQHCVHHAACPVVIIRGDVPTAGPAAARPAQQPAH